MRSTFLATVSLAFGALGLVAGRPAPSSPAVARSDVTAAATSASSPLALPCAATAARTVDPLTIPDRGTATVGTRYAFDCPVGARRSDVVFLQNGQVDPVDIIESERAVNARLKSAMQAFLAAVDAGSGTRVALTVVDTGFQRQVPLSAPTAWPARWGAWATQQAATTGLTAAMRDAASVLAASPSGADRFIVIVLSSAAALGDESELQAACRAVRDSGARLVVMPMPSISSSGTYHALPCVDAFLRPSDPAGADLASAFADLQAITLEPPRVTGVEVFDSLSDAFGYVDGSASPRRPDTAFGNELTWSFASPGAGEHALSYRIRGAIGWSDVRVASSRETRITFTYADGTEARIDLANPQVCIHQRTNPGFCAPKPAPVLFLPRLLRERP